MEFSALAHAHLSPEDLQRLVRIETLPDWCASLVSGNRDGERSLVRFLDRDYRVHREVILSGLRFSLPGCDHALQWTLTVDDPTSPGAVLIHCTVNCRDPDAHRDTLLRTFVEDWKKGLEAGARDLQAARARPVERPEAAPWFG